jgi:hypothetical protein
MIARLLMCCALACADFGVVLAQAPSQRELNGFLIGQHKDAIAASFTQVLQVDTTEDGWIYRSYLLDRPHHAYMTFKFPQDDPAYAISVQIAGDSGTAMQPFLGFVLGSRREAVLAQLGKPSGIDPQLDIGTELYSYQGRNYSLELDSLGRISSIQILGYEGFPSTAPSAGPSMDSLVVGLQSGGLATLSFLMPDLELYRGEKVISFTRGALLELVPDTSQVALNLFRGPTSLLASLQDSAVRAAADMNVRVWPNKDIGWVWKFPPPAAISEVVFKLNAGAWRIWEVHFR